jgi:2-dehydropantoate 2-reductase
LLLQTYLERFLPASEPQPAQRTDSLGSGFVAISGVELQRGLGPGTQKEEQRVSRVLIAGAGALGSVFGGFLRLAGDEVTLLGRQPHLNAIEAHGLRIDGLWGEHCAGGFDLLTDAADVRGSFDAILVTVKAYDTRAAVAATASCLRADGVMISLQNGLGNVEAIVAAVGPERALGGRVIFGAEVTAPGAVRVTVYADPVLVGMGAPGADARLQEKARHWAARFDDAGIPAAFCADVGAALWAKVFYNAALNPLGAVLGVHYGALAEDEHTRAIMDSVIDEAFEVARAQGVVLPWASAAAYREQFYGRLVPATYHHRSSMLQDLERGRRTEIDAINGQVWKRAAAHGKVAPTNEMLTHLIGALEREGMGRRR